MKKAIIRLVVLAVLLANQVLTTIGFDALPFSEDQIYEGVSSLATVAMSIYTWWKNNSVTKEAQHTDSYLQSMKNRKKKQEVK